MKIIWLTSATYILALCLGFPGNEASKSCPLYWHFYGGYCFRYFGNRVTRSAAREACRNVWTNQGRGDLVAIRDGDMNDFVYKLYRQQETSPPSSGIGGFWIGLIQSTATSPWRWPSPFLWSYRNWLPNEPNNVNERCTHAGSLWDDPKWNDVPCNVNLPYVCMVEPYDQD